MKALSLWQPWASLVVLGLKQYETRSWQTSYRGTLVIHAAKTWDEQQFEQWNRFEIRLDHTFAVPRGVALGTVELIGCFQTTPLLGLEVPLGSHEHIFGNWSPGRYAWKLANPIQFPEPIPCAGHQRLWEIGDSEWLTTIGRGDW